MWVPVAVFAAFSRPPLSGSWRKPLPAGDELTRTRSVGIGRARAAVEPLFPAGGDCAVSVAAATRTEVPLSLEIASLMPPKEVVKIRF